MNNRLKLICPICGSHDVEIKDGAIFCLACETYFYDPSIQRNELNEDDIKRIASFERAEEYIRLSPPRFDEAEDRYNKLIKEYPDCSSAYWGALRAKYGIKYEIDVDGKAIPVCYKSRYQNIKEDKLYSLALEKSETDKVRDKYFSEANRIEQTWKAWSEATRKYKYDVFLSFKVSDEKGDDTPDKKVMGELYTYLTSKGYKVFYSPVSMREFTGKPFYDAYIFNALEKANVLIVYGSKPEYFTSTWVENEWSRYLAQISRNEKLYDSLILVHRDFDPSKELPTKLAKRESYDANSYTFFPDIYRLVNKVLTTVKANKPKERKTIIKHVDIEPEKNIRKEVNEDLDLYDVGVNETNKRVDVVNEVHLREIKINKQTTVGVSDQEKLETALICLKNHKFSEAASLYKDIAKSNRGDLTALVGLLASLVHDVTLPHKVLPDKEEDYQYIKSFPEYAYKNIGKHLDVVVAILNNVQYKYQAVNLLRYLVNASMELAGHFERNHPHAKDLYGIAKLVLSYDTDARIDFQRVFVVHVADFMENLETNDFNEIATTVSKAFSNEQVDEYLNFIEDIINACIKSKKFKEAKRWNDKKLASYAGDPKANLRDIYVSLKVKDSNAFYNLHCDKYVAPKVIKKLEICMKKSSKNDIDVLLEDIIKIVLDGARSTYRRKVLYRNARTYFAFLSKYKFNKKQAIQDELAGPQLDTLISNNHVDFVFVLARTIRYEEDASTIARLAYMSRGLRNCRQFNDASRVCEIGLKRFKNNAELLYEKLLAKIKFDNYNTYAISWNDKYYNQKGLEGVLKYCSKEEQKKYITDLADLLESSLQSINHPSRFRDLIKAYDLTLRYIDINEEKLLKRINELALKCLEHSEFNLASKYATLSLEKQPTSNITANYVFLMVKIKCPDEEAFKYSRKFSRDLVEYKNLIVACKDDYQKINYYSNLADRNEEYRNSYKRRSYKSRYKSSRRYEKVTEKNRINRLKNGNPHHNGDLTVFETISWSDVSRGMFAGGITLLIGGLFLFFINDIIWQWIVGAIVVAIALIIGINVTRKK